jgi:hypothetical protein
MKMGISTTILILLFNLPAFSDTPKIEMAMIQCRLKLAGYEPGPIDGLYGQKTVKAIQRFRRKKRLRTDNPLYWYHVLLNLTQGQLHRCKKPLEAIANKVRRAAQDKN